MKKVLVIGEILVEIMADRTDQSFLEAWLKEQPLENCLKTANAAGASAVSKRGPMEETVSLEEIADLIV